MHKPSTWCKDHRSFHTGTFSGTDIASHAGVFRGARFSSLKTSSPKNACVGGYYGYGFHFSGSSEKSVLYRHPPPSTHVMQLLFFARLLFCYSRSELVCARLSDSRVVAKKNTKENEDARNQENGVALSLSSTPARFSHQFSRSWAFNKLHLSVLSLSLCISGSKMPICFDTLYKLHQRKIFNAI